MLRGMDIEEIERLEAAVREARRAVSEHVSTVATAWYGDNAPAEEPRGTLDAAWLDTYQALRAAENDAQRELDDYLNA